MFLRLTRNRFASFRSTLFCQGKPVIKYLHFTSSRLLHSSKYSFRQGKPVTSSNSWLQHSRLLYFKPVCLNMFKGSRFGLEEYSPTKLYTLVHVRQSSNRLRRHLRYIYDTNIYKSLKRKPFVHTTGKTIFHGSALQLHSSLWTFN